MYLYSNLPIKFPELYDLLILLYNLHRGQSIFIQGLL